MIPADTVKESRKLGEPAKHREIPGSSRKATG
jgi:hypothetical protein